MSLIPNGETTTEEEITEITEEAITTNENKEVTESKGYLFADGIVGEGDAPEWFKTDKYKTVSAQAEAYGELESKFGAFSGTPKDGYDVEGVDIEESPLLKTAAAWGAENQLSNDGLSSLMERVNALATEQIEQDLVNAKTALGDKAEERLGNLSQWGKNNLSVEEYTQFQGLAQNAGQVEVIEKLVGMAKNSKIVKADTHIPDFKDNAAELSKLQTAVDVNGKRKMEIDPAYRKMVNEKMKAFYNKTD